MDIVDAYTVQVNLRRYPKFWQDFLVAYRLQVELVLTWNDSKMFKSVLRHGYNLDANIHVGDIVGIVYMRPNDAVWFNLQWS
jgi:hypothetical protein